jgi:hypothetical protein
MGMETGQILAAFAADKFYFAEYLGGVLFRRKRAVAVLQIMGRHQNVLGNFNKIFIIAALLADNTPSRFSGGNVDFFHKLVNSLVRLNSRPKDVLRMQTCFF